MLFPRTCLPWVVIQGLPRDLETPTLFCLTLYHPSPLLQPLLLGSFTFTKFFLDLLTFSNKEIYKENIPTYQHPAGAASATRPRQPS